MPAVSPLYHCQIPSWSLSLAPMNTEPGAIETRYDCSAAELILTKVPETPFKKLAWALSIAASQVMVVETIA